jgi:hypothetical protein
VARSRDDAFALSRASNSLTIIANKRMREATMPTRVLTVELPEELVDLIGSPEDVAAKARDALVLDLLREGTISQGQVAQMLGLSRWDVLELMAKHGIPSGPETAEEMRREIDDARHVASQS